VAKTPPTFLEVYVIPVLLLNLVVGGWSVLAAHGAPGVVISLGYVVIVAVSLYLLYLDRYISQCRPVGFFRSQPR
jgi:hypothetical protein